MIFNWKIFTIILNVDLGFGVVKLPPFIILFLLGFFLIGILSWISYVSSLQKTIYELEQGVELGKMKDKLIQNKVREQLLNPSQIDELKKKMGIAELGKQQEELVKVVSELSSRLKNDTPQDPA
jgi:hypothetical protein